MNNKDELKKKADGISRGNDRQKKGKNMKKMKCFEWLGAMALACSVFLTMSADLPGQVNAQEKTKTVKSGTRLDAQGHTLNGWGQTDADYDFFKVSREVKPEADGWRTKDIASDPNVYEWWYFDIHNEDGTIINGTLSPTTAFGFVPRVGEPKALSKLGINRKGVQSDKIETFPLTQFDAATDRCDVRAGRLTMRGDFEELHIKGKVGDHEIDVTFKQAAMPFRPGNGYIFLGSTEKFQGWFNAYPSSHANGWIKIGDETIKIDGDGYHDHDYGNVPIAEGYRGWFWARPSCGRYATLAIEVQNGERLGGGSAPVFWVYDKEARKELVRAITLDDLTITIGKMVPFPDPVTGGAYPSLTVYDYRHGEDRARIQINDTGVLVGFFLHDLTNTQTQKYLTSIGSNGPYYTRRSSNVDLSLNLPSLGVKDNASGFALHELEESYWPQYLAPR